MASENKLRGKFIVLDGPDGCGKSTQAKLLTEWLQSQGVPTSSFRDPGDTYIGEKIRQILLSPEHIAMSTRTEMLLYMAARAQLWQEKMVPALRDKHCVILDRWVSSTCAYQGNAGGFGMPKVIKLATDSLARPWPDLTIILDVDVKTGFKRLPGKLDRMEAKGRKYHQKVREGFLELARQQENFVVIDASRNIEEVHKKIIEIVEGF
jgi:dTMP kinase